MKISTKGRYAIRVMIDLAEHNTGEYIPLMDIAGRQEISEKYLESIVAVLSKNDLLISLRGKGGGYKLARQPQEYRVGEILRLTERFLCTGRMPGKETEPLHACGWLQDASDVGRLSESDGRAILTISRLRIWSMMIRVRTTM